MAKPSKTKAQDKWRRFKIPLTLFVVHDVLLTGKRQAKKTKNIPQSMKKLFLML